MSKLIYLDSFNVGSDHEVFNSSSLLMFSHIYSKVDYYSCKSSRDATFSLIKEIPSNINYIKIPVLSSNSLFESFLHHFITAIINILFVIKARNSTLIINVNNLWELPALNFLMGYMTRKVIVICHGELEYLVNGKRLNCFSEKSLHWLLDDSTTISRGLYFSVLGESILGNVRKVLPYSVATHFISFNHTFISSVISPQSNYGEYPCIGVVGTAHPNKGLNEILSFGNKLKEVLPNCLFYTLGRVLCDTKILKDNNVHYIEDSDIKFVERNILISKIKEMDIIVFLHDIDSYKFTASGALMDAIDCEKNILSLHNDYFDCVNSLVMFGQMFYDIDDMIKCIENKGYLKIHKDFTVIKKKIVTTIGKY